MNSESDSPNTPSTPDSGDARPAEHPEMVSSHAAATPEAAPRRRRPSKRTLWIAGAVAGVLAIGGAGIAVAEELGDGSDSLDDATRDRIAAIATAHAGGGELVEAERDDDGGYDAEVRLEDGTDVDVRLDDDFSVVSSGTDDRDDTDVDDDSSDDDSSNDEASDDDSSSGNNDDRDGSGNGTDGDGTDDDTSTDSDQNSDDAPLTADETDRASDAALRETGDGEVVDVDRSDDASHAFEVEVRLEDGTEVEVRLDADFSVVDTRASN